MTRFRQLWEIGSFQELFREFARLDDDGLQAVARIAMPRGDSGRLPELSREQRMLVPVAETLLQVRNRDGSQELIADIAQLAEPELPGITSRLEGLLHEDPKTESQRLVGQTQTSTLPVVVGMDIDVDFRAAPPTEGRPVQLVPVVVVRMMFDEPVGGSDVIVFQVPDERISELIQELRSADRTRGQVLAKLSDDLFPPTLRRSLGLNLPEAE